MAPLLFAAGELLFDHLYDLTSQAFCFLSLGGVVVEAGRYPAGKDVGITRGDVLGIQRLGPFNAGEILIDLLGRFRQFSH